MRKAPRRGLRLAKFQFLLFLLVCFLLPDVIADDLFRHTDGADAVPARPKVGVGARMRAGLRASNRRARHLPMGYETGLPSSVIRFRT